MTKCRATILLLQHGPLKLEHFELITGWSRGQCYRVLSILVDEGQVMRIEKGVYAVKDFNA